MDYAFTLLIPLIGGLLLGNWLSRQFGISQLWTLLLGFIGLGLGFAAVYKRMMETKLKHIDVKKLKPPSDEGLPHDELPWHQAGFFDETPDDDFPSLDELDTELDNDKPFNKTDPGKN